MTSAPTIQQPDGVGKLGIQLLLTAEFMLFSGLVAAYLVLKSGSRGAFHASAELLHGWPVAAVVALGLASVLAYRASTGYAPRRNLLAAMVLAGVYFGLMAMQWAELEHPRHGVYSACYYLLSGAVAVHVLATAIATGSVLFRLPPSLVGQAFLPVSPPGISEDEGRAGGEIGRNACPTEELARSADRVQCVAMLWHFAVAAGLVTLILLHGA